MIITIDGPAGSGKSTIAKELAKKLNFYYLYTGLLYRAVAHILIAEHGKVDLTKIKKEDLSFIPKISYEYEDGTPVVFLQGHALKDLLNLSLDQPASVAGANKNIREALLPIQRNVAKKYDIIADGRDCGSVVFLDADYKFFLTASLDVRAKRIFDDKKRGDSCVNFEKVKQELEVRDRRDMEREVAPLKIPESAIIIDSSNLSKEETLNKFLFYIKKPR
jgi:CMP/dCMP kinase